MEDVHFKNHFPSLAILLVNDLKELTPEQIKRALKDLPIDVKLGIIEDAKSIKLAQKMRKTNRLDKDLYDYKSSYILIIMFSIIAINALIYRNTFG